MPFPTDFTPVPTNMQGTTLLADTNGDDHSLAHRTLGSIVNAMGTKLGLTSGTPANNQALIGNGGGSAGWSGTWNQAALGSPTLTGGTLNNPIIGTPSSTGGTASSITLGTPSIDFISARNSGTGVGFNQSIFPSEGTIVDSAGGTLAVDARASQIYYSVVGTAAGNRTIGTPTNPSNYQLLTYAFKTSGSANGTLVWTPIFRLSQNTGTPALGTGVGWNYYSWRYNAIDTKWDFMGLSLNLI